MDCLLLRKSYIKYLVEIVGCTHKPPEEVRYHGITGSYWITHANK